DVGAELDARGERGGDGERQVRVVLGFRRPQAVVAHRLDLARVLGQRLEIVGQHADVELHRVSPRVGSSQGRLRVYLTPRPASTAPALAFGVPRRRDAWLSGAMAGWPIDLEGGAVQDRWAMLAPYYGWYVVAACATIACFSWGFAFYGLGVYLHVLVRLHGW